MNKNEVKTDALGRRLTCKKCNVSIPGCSGEYCDQCGKSYQIRSDVIKTVNIAFISLFLMYIIAKIFIWIITHVFSRII